MKNKVPIIISAIIVVIAIVYVIILVFKDKHTVSYNEAVSSEDTLEPTTGISTEYITDVPTTDNTVTADSTIDESTSEDTNDTSSENDSVDWESQSDLVKEEGSNMPTEFYNSTYWAEFCSHYNSEQNWEYTVTNTGVYQMTATDGVYYYSCEYIESTAQVTIVVYNAYNMNNIIDLYAE